VSLNKLLNGIASTFEWLDHRLVVTGGRQINEYLLSVGRLAKATTN